MNRLAMKQLIPRTAREGTVTVETALTIGIALLFFFASLEFCRVAMIRHTVNNAIYEGARKGTLPGGTVQDVTAECNRILSTIGLRDSQITVSPNPITASTSEISVSISVPINQNLFSPANFFKDKTITNNLTMQMQR